MCQQDFWGRFIPILCEEVQQLMAIQIACKARHTDVFTRRSSIKKEEPALTAAGGQESWKHCD
ncbi:MAG: hypothetical protein H6625_10530 [Bdellovibrionaceae bacterium]|nr:hypothetical protein [Pseudobdellovibrionaceae bacterium]